MQIIILALCPAVGKYYHQKNRVEFPQSTP